MHEELKALFEKDATVHPRPCELWFFRGSPGAVWRQNKFTRLSFCAGFEYRRHRHADLMIEAHQNPDAKWEMQATDTRWVPATPDWEEEIEYRREHPHREFLDAIKAGAAEGNWEVQSTRWSEETWSAGWGGAQVACVTEDPKNWKTRRTVHKHEAKTPHPHAESILEYAKDWMETDMPWERWEFREHACDWSPLRGDHPTWNPEFNYRRKHVRQFVMVNGVKVPAPYRGPLVRTAEYFIADPIGLDMFGSYRFDYGDTPDEVERLQEMGVLHLTVDAAVAHAKAMLNIS